MAGRLLAVLASCAACVASVSITVDWKALEVVLHTTPSVQFVSQRFLFQNSPIYAGSWESLQNLSASTARLAL